MKPAAALKKWRAADTQWRRIVCNFFAELGRDAEAVALMKRLFCEGVSEKKLGLRLRWMPHYENAVVQVRTDNVAASMVTIRPLGLPRHRPIELPSALVGKRDLAVQYWKAQIEDKELQDAKYALTMFRRLERRFRQPKGADKQAIAEETGKAVRHV